MVRKLLVWAGVLLAIVAVCAPAGARVWNVTDIYNFDTAMAGLSPGDEVVMGSGTYDLTLKHGYYINTPDVTIRGASGNRDDVILWGGGINNTSGILEAIQLAAPNITISDLTIEGFYHHAIHFQGAGDGAVIRNVKTLNIGEQHMKGSGGDIRDGLVEFSEMAQTIAPLNNMPNRPDEYTGGIDLHGAVGWTIRDNYIHDIQGPLGDGDAGIFLWNGSNDNVIERNVIANINKGIAIGNYSSQTINYRNTVRNNFVLQEPDNDVGVEMFATVDNKVLNNSVIHTLRGGNSSNTHRTFMVGWATTGLEVVNNIFRGNINDLQAVGDWSNATVAAMGNIVGFTAQPDWFVDMLAGDLHLTEYAAAAINQGTVLVDVPEDFDGAVRPSSPDLGADEYGVPIMGDANMDGRVGLADLTAMADNYGRMDASWRHGDFTGEGTVGLSDLTALADNYGRTIDGVSVPEPATLLLTLAGAVMLLRRRRA